MQEERAPSYDPALPDADLCPCCSSPAGAVLFSGRDRLRDRPGIFNVVECVRCGLVRINPTPTQNPATLKLEWIRDDGPSSLLRRLIKRGRQLAAGPVAKLVQRCARSGGTVLDLGGGAILSSELHLRGLAVVTAAPPGWPVSSFFKTAGVPVVQNSLPEACFRRGAFDVIVSNHVLEHQRDPRAAINAMLEMLANDGSIVIQVPNANSWQALLLAGAWAGFDIPRHRVVFDSASLERCLETCGLSVATRRPCSNIEAAFCLATSLCPWLDPDLRQLRGVQEHPIVEGLKDMCYCLFSVVLLPLVLLEYASGSGPTVLVEARRTTDLAPSSNDQQDDGREPRQDPSAVTPEEERRH